MSEENTKKKVYGIDLGTTYSAISFINDDGKAEIINNSDGLPITASAVYFESPENIVVGETAKEQGKIDSTRVVDLIKREMGTDWRRDFDDKEYTPQSISALILKYLVKGAAQAGHKVEDVVITCPAYFGEKEREATHVAGVIAGLNVLQIIDEPIAAALNYGIGSDTEGTKNVIVYDLGGGTFDVTIVRVSPQGVEVLCSDGDHHLGGADWDNRLESLLADKFMEACPSAGNPQDDVDSRYELHNQTEKVKKKLSNAMETSIAISHNGEKAKIVITRQEFEENTRDLLEKTIDFTDSMLAFAKEKHGVEKIDDFLLVGGSTYMPQVSDIINARYKDLLGIEPKVFEPNYAVSKGAAVFGNTKMIKAAVEEKKEEIRQENPELSEKEVEDKAINNISVDYVVEPSKIIETINTTIKTVASKSYGIRVLNKAKQRVCFNLIQKQTAVPCSNTQTFPVSEANAATLPILVFSNDSTEIQEEIELCSEVGEATMDLTPGLPKGAPIEVIFTLSEDGHLSLTARDVTNNKEIHSSFEVKDGLTEEEIAEQKEIVAELQISD